MKKNTLSSKTALLSAKKLNKLPPPPRHFVRFNRLIAPLFLVTLFFSTLASAQTPSTDDLVLQATASITDGGTDSTRGIFDELDGAISITTVVIGGKTYALVASSKDDGVQIIDITTPTAPTAVASITDGTTFDELDAAYGITTVVIDGKTYALVASFDDDGVQIIDITTPTDPTAVASITDGGVDSTGMTFDELDGAISITTVVIDGKTYALVASFNDDGVQIIDITTPAAPTAVASITDGTTFNELDGAISITTVMIGTKTYALVASSFDDGVQIIDITDPTTPLAIASITDGAMFDELSGAYGITTVVIDGKTYALVVSFSDDGVQIIDITDPTTPLAIASITDGAMFDELSGASNITTVVIDDKTYALVASSKDDGVQIIDITTPTAPTAVASITDGTTFDELLGARSITTVVIDGKPYALVASFDDDGVQIIQLSNEAPTITSSNTFSVVEGITDVGTLTAIDPDGTTPTFSITGGADQTAFTLTTAGVLTFNTAPDFEAKTSYTIEVTASDGILSSSAQTITITVTDVNEAPVITGGNTDTVTFSVAENATVGTGVGTVTATDPDNDILTFSIIAGNTGNTFAIDPRTGAITITSPLSGTMSSYSLIVTVTDGGTPALSDTATITVNVLSRDDFVLKITTTAGTNSEDKTFTFHTQDIDYEIDWGNDGTFEMTSVSGNVTHIFPTAGVHTIRFRNLIDIYINDSTGKEKYTAIEQWGTGTWNADMSRAFWGANNLTMSENAGTPTMSAVTNMFAMFAIASSFNGDISGWNTEAVKDMSSVFNRASSFNGDISGWNTKTVTDMGSMFNGASSFNGNISGWNTVAVTDMGRMFEGATAFNRDLSGWNTASVTRMDFMFNGASSFNRDISRWNTVAVTDMERMFEGATAFNHDLSSWNTASVMDMSFMFSVASSFNHDLSGWNTASVTNMSGMFSGATSFNSDLSGWNTASVTNMSGMFFDATAFNDDLSRWNAEAVTDMTGMFDGIRLSPTNYDSLLIGWNAQNLRSGIRFNAGDSKYNSDAAHAARTNMMNPTASGGDGWTIADGGRVNQAPTINDATFGVTESATTGSNVGTVTATDFENNTLTYSITAGNTGNAFAIDQTTGVITVAGVLNRATMPVYLLTVKATDGGTPALSDTATITVNVLSRDDFVLKITTTAGTETFTFHTQDTNYEIDWDNDGTFEVADANGDAMHIFPIAGVHTIRFRKLTDIFINNSTGKEKYTSIEQWGTGTWDADMSNAFYGAENLIGGYTDTPDMSAVTNMKNMFYGASSFNGDMSGWNTASVTSMDSAFEKASSFNGDLSGWNTASVTNMFQMLAETAFNHDISGWNVEAVTNMDFMFFGVTLSFTNYNALLIGWNAQNLQAGVLFSAGSSQYSSNAAHEARANMKAMTTSGGDGWIISDSGRGNRVPVISGTPPTTAEGGRAYSFRPIVTNVDPSTTLTYSITNEPSWTSFDSATGRLSGTPTSANVGTTSGIVITVVTSGMESASLPSFNLEVTNTNREPKIDDDTFSVAENAPVGTEVGTVTATDPDNDILTFSIIGGNTENAFAIDITTGVITVAGTLNSGTRSSYSLTVAVVDDRASALSDTAIITVNVIAATAPIISISTNMLTTGVNVDITPITITSTGGQVDSYSISPDLAEGLSFDVSTGTISGRPTTIAGKVLYTITATNIVGTASVTVAITVDATAGNEDFKKIGVSVWPNPTNDIINIHNIVEDKATYSLFNITGKVLKKGVLTKGYNSVNISLLAKGVYFLNIKTSKGSLIEKVVRN